MQPNPQLNPNLAPPGTLESIARPAAVLAGTLAVGLTVRAVVDVALPGVITAGAVVAGGVLGGLHEYGRIRSEQVELGRRQVAWRIAKAVGKGALIGAAISFGMMGLEGVIGHSPFVAALGGGIAGGTLNGMREAGRIRNEQNPVSRREAAARVTKATLKGTALGGSVAFGLGGIGWVAEHGPDWLPGDQSGGGTQDIVDRNNDGVGNNPDDESGGGGDNTYGPGDGEDEAAFGDIQTGELGVFDGTTVGEESDRLVGTADHAISTALENTVAANGQELDLAELRDSTPGVEALYNDFMEDVLASDANGVDMSAGEDRFMQPDDTLTIDGDRLNEFVADLNETAGTDYDTADFAASETATSPGSAALLEGVDEYVAHVVETNPEMLTGDPITFGEGYISYLQELSNLPENHPDHSDLYATYVGMNQYQQMGFLADLFAKLTEETKALVEAAA